MSAVAAVAAVDAVDAPADFTGELVRPTDASYDTARRGWNQLYQRYPALIAYCADTRDVVTALRWARETDTEFRVRSGGHHLEGWSGLDGGLVIDVSRMKSVAVDEAAGLATVGTGLNQREAVAALGAHGYVLPTGSEGAVGLGGVVLGGGFGLLTRRLGLACDRLVGVEMVLADGERGARVVHADEGTAADLLWACRGGGGNTVGIATAYTMALHRLAPSAFGYLSWTGHDGLPEVLRRWQRSAPVADDRLSSALEIGTDGFTVSALWFDGGRAELLAGLAPLLGVGAPEVVVDESAWPAVYATVDKAPLDVANWKFFSQFVTRPFPDEAIDIVCRFMAAAPTPASNYYLSSFGGAVRQPPPGGSVFPHRHALFYCEPGAGWNGAEATGRALGWVADFATALRPFVDGAYVNVPNAAAADWEQQYYGANAARLRAVKADYDPLNVFHHEQSVPAPG